MRDTLQQHATTTTPSHHMRLRLKRERHEDTAVPNRAATRRRVIDLMKDQHEQDDRHLRFSAEDWLELAELLGKAVEEEAQAKPPPPPARSSDLDTAAAALGVAGVAVLAA